MSVLHRLASSQGRRDDVPNQELARELAAARDHNAIRELVAYLHDGPQHPERLHQDPLRNRLPRA